MKKLTSVLVLCLVFLTSQAQTYKTYSFSKPELKRFGNYTEVKQTASISYGKDGWPELPYYSVLMKNISSITIDSISYYPVITDVTVMPKQKESITTESLAPTPKNDSIYGLKMFPGKIVDFNKYSFTIATAIFYPQKKELKAIKYIRLRITTLKAKSAVQSAQQTITEPYDVLIITKENLTPPLIRYKKFKEGQGYYTKIITTEDIYSRYSGIDKQEKIRNCIRDYYQNNGVKYVILGGTSLPSLPNRDVIPHRGMWGNYPIMEEDLPADIYYSNLDGNWINPGDTCYGQPGSEDLTTEVFVGRFPVVDTTDLGNVVNKLIRYQDYPVVDDVLKMAMIGEVLNSASNVYGSTDMENLITTGKIPQRFTLSKLYDSLGKTNVTADAVMALYNNTGTHMFNHLGHSGGQSNMKLFLGYYMNRNPEIVLVQNNGVSKTFSVVYSQGCYAGALDMRDGRGLYWAEDPWYLRCISGAAMASKYGTVAYICNTRYGFYSYNSSSSSQQYHRQFLLSLFDKNITQIGDAFYDAKSVIAPLIPSPMSGTNIRWTYYALSLWGDPSMYVLTNTPTDIIANYPTSISFGIDEIPISTNTPGARVAILSSSGVLMSRAITDPNGDCVLKLSAPISSGSYLSLSIIGPNKNRFSGKININYTRITGSVSYSNSVTTPIANVLLKLSDGIKTFETYTTSNGSYNFYNIPPGSYTLKAYADGRQVGGINSIDAQQIMQHFTGLIKLTGTKLKAADADNNGYVNSVDAMVVSKYFTGMPIPPNTNMGKWCFDEKTVLANKPVVIAIVKALCYGDVNGSYVP